MKSEVTIKRAELPTWTAELAAKLERPSVLRLMGEMGAGKTTLVRHLVQALGGEDAADSPTYALINKYVLPSGPCYHVDLYRLENDDDLESIGFWDLFSEDSALVIVEWADRLPEDCFPPRWKVVNLEIKKDVNDSETRHLSLY